MIILKNGRIEPISAPGFFGDIMMDGGKIVSMGRDLSGENAQIIDVRGLTVYPGFIDPHCHIGLSESGNGATCQDENEHTSPLLPELRGIDSLNPMDESFREAREVGITTCVTGPGSSGLITGQFCAVKTWGRTAEKMTLRAPLAMKMSLGENPKLAHGTNRKVAPETRMSEIALLREILYKTKEYARKKERDPEGTAMNMKLEALVPVVKGDMPVKIHVHRADDIMNAIGLAKEFSLRFSLEHCTEGHLIPEEILEAEETLDAKVLLGPLMMPRRKLETRNLSDKGPCILEKGGVHFGLMSDHPVTPLQYLPLYAGLAVRQGASETCMLRAITLEAARACWIEDRVGSLEEGKDGDLAIFEGNPLSLEGKCRMTFINGELVYKMK